MCRCWAGAGETERLEGGPGRVTRVDGVWEVGGRAVRTRPGGDS